MKTKKVFIPLLIILFIVLLIVLPYLSKAVVNGLLLKEPDYKLDSSDRKMQTALLKKDDFVVFGEYMGEPILWEVLSANENETLLMTKYVVCFKAFDASGESKHNNSSDTAKYGSQVWEGSSLQKWLNSDEIKVNFDGCVPDKNSVNLSQNAYDDESGFLCDKNFSKKQKSLIKDRRVFVLSKEEMSKYLSVKNRTKTATVSAIKNNESSFILAPSKTVWFWTSSPVTSNNVSVTSVTTSGSYYKAMAYDGNMGVAPSIKLNGNEIKIKGGNGTEDYPYFICREAV